MAAQVGSLLCMCPWIGSLACHMVPQALPPTKPNQTNKAVARYRGAVSESRESQEPQQTSRGSVTWTPSLTPPTSPKLAPGPFPGLGERESVSPSSTGDAPSPYGSLRQPHLSPHEHVQVSLGLLSLPPPSLSPPGLAFLFLEASRPDPLPLGVSQVLPPTGSPPSPEICPLVFAQA